jgi:hypothetical protein
LGENLFFVWDKQPGAAWDFGIRGGFLSTDQLVLKDDNGQDILDYDTVAGGGTVATAALVIGRPVGEIGYREI